MIFTLQDAIVSSSDISTMTTSTTGYSSVWDTPALLVGIRTYTEENDISSLSTSTTSTGTTTTWSISSSPFIRSILRWGFRTAVKIVCFPDNLGVQDTQCGLKLMTTK